MLSTGDLILITLKDSGYGQQLLSHLSHYGVYICDTFVNGHAGSYHVIMTHDGLKYRYSTVWSIKVLNAA
jgi:hypothetical protein